MKLTTKGRYAVTAALDLALHDDQAVSLAALTERQKLSTSYLEQLFHQLKGAGIVRSIRGPGGGYKLGASAAEISVGRIVRAVERDFDATQCGGTGDCQRGLTCLTHSLWQDLNEEVYRFLEGISLAELCQRVRRERTAQQSSQSIEME